jgi:hypothetical protein
MANKNNIPRIAAVDASNTDISAMFLPRIYRTDANKKFLHSTINQLIQPGVANKVSGHIGRSYSKSTLSNDIFVTAPSRTRQNYQLEPGFIIDDDMDNTIFLKDYQDYINQLRVFGADVSNHSKLNKQEFYSWNPHIDWDKFVNFQNYYWMPHGPDTITIRNTSKIEVTSAYTVSVETTEYGSSYIFSPDGLTRNPVITLYRGRTYKFIVNSFGNIFSIKTSRTSGPLDRYVNPLLINNSIEDGVITFTVPDNAPDELAYVSESNVDMGGVINILDLSDTGYINVEAEIIGKKTYNYGNVTLINGETVPFELSNGMKIQFARNVFPKKYASSRYYVEGVGKSIQLINEVDLQIITAYTASTSMLFDNTLFDTTPFSDSNSYVTQPDYIVINRGSADKNFWSRNNKWIHKDIIEKTALINKVNSVYDQKMRAARPIIEFEKNLKLFNFGIKSSIDISVIDTTTVDAFSIVEGSLGYNIDGVSLKNGQHVIFTADKDTRVTNKIFQVQFIDVLHQNELRKISNAGTVANIKVTNDGWTATITGMSSTAGLSIGSLITASNGTGKLGGAPIGVSGSATVLAIIDSTSIEYKIVGAGKPTRGKIKNIVDIINSKQIRLVEVSEPEYNQVVLVQHGNKFQGTMFWFNGISWQLCQQKTKSNQPPLFDVVDVNEESFGNLSVYPGTTFNGTELFSYKIGTSSLIDTNLGFPLSYKNINNIGDIVFNFSLITDTFNYEVNDKIINKAIDTGFLISHDDQFNILYLNGWETCKISNTQAAIRLYRNSNKTNNFDIDIFDYLPRLEDIEVRVYVNNVRSLNWKFKSFNAANINRYQQYHQIIFVDSHDHPIELELTDSVLIKVYSGLSINANGYYEIPINLQNNPLNGVLSEFTLGEVIDHVGSIVDNIHTHGFTGKYPGLSNLRDLGPVSQFGTKFVQHSGPASLSAYHITSGSNNVIRAIEQSRDDYCKFKKTFIVVAESLGVDANPVSHVTLILQQINRDVPSTSPYYFSDMVPYGTNVRIDFTVSAPEDNLFSLSKIFNLSKLSNVAVGVYLNDMQLLHGKEYTFTDQGFVLVSAALTAGDIITIYEYDSTDGCLIPETPTKLGLWPKYEPKIFLDTSLVIPRTMIQGHDGSLILAYGDYRDDLLLELEKRIYNNIKVQYNPSIFDITDIIPSYTRPTDYTLSQYNSVLAINFYAWSAKIGIDFSTVLSFDKHNPFTFNYSNHTAPNGQPTPGYWRGIYRWMLDTDRPHMCPWEMLGFSEEPSWWTTVYGPAPYTRNNLILWNDISNGLIKEPNKPVVNRSKYIKPFLMDHIPVDEDGNLLSPFHTNLSVGYVTPSVQGDFTFGDGSPIETAWQRNSHYAFSVIKTAILLNPARLIGILMDRSRIIINKTGQLVYKDTGVRITPSSIVFPTVYLSTTRVQTAGLINYLINYINCNDLMMYNTYKSNLENIKSKVCHRVSAFTSKEKFNLLLDSKSPTSVGNIFIPQEDYKLVLNTSSPISTITYSGVIITKVQGGFEIKGYSRVQPYFKYYTSIVMTGKMVNVAGISESFMNWTQNQDYYTGMIVKYELKFYRVIHNHSSSLIFDSTKFYPLLELPIVGGVNALFKQKWNTDAKIAPYGTKFESIQEVVDFLIGYGKWLTNQGFIFNEFNTELNVVENWETSANEFMFWTTQNWTFPTTTWLDWTQGMMVNYGDIIRYNGEYYKSLRTTQSSVFNESDFYLLNGLNLSGNSVISLSPSAKKITFNALLSTVDDISNTNNEYEILNASGNPIHNNFINMFRLDNALTYQSKSDDGIYCATFYLVQREHIVVINNTTMFNDTIYNPESGYKQDKIRVSGYVSSNWNGTLNAPGFIVDQVTITEWTQWKRYVVGDVVRYKSFYYSANVTIVGEEIFDSTKWIKLDKKPTSKLLPNWNYKATQFTDFYSLDSENFDIAQQNHARHLTGYQKRQYLENIIQDDVSEYKFYQGMIIEKGTQNVLNKLFDVLSATGNESLQFYEEWAIRTGQYGACSAFENVEFILSESQFKINPQGFELVNNRDRYHSTLVIQQGISDIYLKPASYKPNVWPVSKPSRSLAMYARVDEVAHSVKKLANLDISTLKHNDYILCTFTPPLEIDWNVYQYMIRNIVITEVHIHQFSVDITVSNIQDIQTNDIICLTKVGSDGLYTVTNVISNIITIDAVDVSISITPSSKIGIFKSRRVPQTIDFFNYRQTDLSSGSLLWTDNDSNPSDFYKDTNNWKVWEYNPVYSLKNKPNLNLNMHYYGRAVASSADGKVVAVSTLTNHEYNLNIGEVLVYNNTEAYGWIATQSITAPLRYQTKISIDDFSKVATVLSVSADGTWLGLGSPMVDNNDHGVVSIYKRDITNLYVLVDTIISPSPVNNERFGQNIEFGNNMVIIGTNIGKVYRYAYTLTPIVSTTYVSNGSSGITLKVASTTNIEQGMMVSGKGFTNQIVSLVVNATTIIISDIPNDMPGGVITFSLYTWDHIGEFIVSSVISTAMLSISVSENNTVAISHPTTNGSIYIYYANDLYISPTVIPITAAIAGQSIALSTYNNYIAISNQISTINCNVLIYDLTTDSPTLVKTISTLEFASTIACNVLFANDFSTIVLCNNNSTTGYVNIIDVYDIYNSDWIFSERVLPINASPTAIAVTTQSVIIGASTVNATMGTVYEYRKPVNKFSWEVKNTSITKPDITKIKQAFLYNKNTNDLIKYLDIVDPIQNKYPNVAEREIKYKSTYDPAIYSFVQTDSEIFLTNKTANVNTDTALNDPTKINVDAGIAWGTAQVGSLWWNLRTAVFVDNYTDNVVYRNSMLSTLATGASIDVYEWVETELLPSEWDAEADTDAGIALGISGTSLYGDNAYVEIKTYDTLSQTFSSTYYYWVKNKETIALIVGRSISAANVARLIANPKGEGYEYLALTGLNSFSLVNIRPLLSHEDVVLSVEYWTIDNVNQNIHSQWKLISNAPSSIIPSYIEQKWIDSLCGKDIHDRLVPDQTLPAKLKYGVENRPRQSMFINRFEAIKQLIEQTNIYLKLRLIVETRNLKNLKKYDLPPSSIRGLYDIVIDTDAELQYVITKYFVQPVLTAEMTDGKVTNVIIENSGKGYLIAPYVTVIGSGKNAVIQTNINDLGEITSVKIINSGEGYDSKTVLTVRTFSVLVSSDLTSNGKWSIYSFVNQYNWYKVLTYTYDTTKYWSYTDWYATGVNQFTAAQHLVNTYADLSHITTKVGDIVKVQTTSEGRWVLLKKHVLTDVQIQSLLTKTSYDWTDYFTVIGSQRGTIQFSSLLYDFKSTIIGYDGMLFDSNAYDNYADIELRIILTAIKDDLLIDELRSEYLSLFLSTIRYALSEQTYVDWIFKTSFVNVIHQVGNLTQKVTYKNDNLSNFEDYVSEVKPYRTQVREYISSYTNLENSNVTISDFDLPPVFDTDRNVVTVVDYDNPLINTYPWKFWLDNVGYSITDIKIISGGSDYLTEPTVTIESSTGSGATARAYIANRQISRIKLITPGSGYKTTPKIVITGGYSNKGTSAIAIPILGNSVVRTNDIKLKFDRIYQNFVVDNLQYTETLTNVTGRQVQFTLSWIPDVRVGKTTVTVNGVVEIRDNYKMGTVISIVNGHPVYTGVITFANAPSKGSTVNVSYYKDTSALTATDRIHYYYNPTSGEIGNDIPQLMSGVDYGGVVVSGLSFEVDHGWDSMPYYNDTWDNFDPAQNDVKYTIGGEFSYTIKLPYIPDIGTKFNVYYLQVGQSVVRIDAADYEVGVIRDTSPNAAMLTPIANGITDIIEIPTSINAGEGDTIIVRKETSDGSVVNDYDVELSGGNFSYSSILTGLLAEDIIIDGDEFNSITAGIGPEEVVPGQVVDTVGIKVFTDSTIGAYMQFKNMLNQVSYFRLNVSKNTKLVKDLHYYDTTITVENSLAFDPPAQIFNKPGVIDINGERIEFFTNVNNVLGGLRRGTLGTGIPTVHNANSVVQELGSTEAIPYTDDIQTEQVVVVDGNSHFINLSFSPTKVLTNWTFKNGFISSIPADYGQADDIEVFVGGYDTTKVWTLDTMYKVNEIVNVGVYVYRCNVDHTSGTEFKNDRYKWSYFIGNIRLKKAPYTVYNINDSNGEVQFDADFSVNGTTKQIRLTNVLSPNTVVTIVKRQGNRWVSNQIELNFINSVTSATYH